MRIRNIFGKISNRIDLEVYPDAVIIINALNEIAGWNRKSEKIFGYLESEIIGRNIAILFDSDIEKIHLSVYENKSQILNAKTRNQKDIIVEITCGEFSKDGKTIISVKDITNSQKVIEKLLLEYDRVSKIAGHKSGFIAAYSTELKNPLHSIISFSQGMIDGVCGKLDEKQEKYVSIVNKNANNLLSLIDNMIILSKIEADKLKVEHKVFDISELLESVKNDVNHLVLEKNINFEVDYSLIERKEVYSDETFLRQILFNLITNAIKFTDMGQVTVNLSHPEIETVSESGIQPLSYFTGKSYILFSVTDTGMGISDEERDKIFDEFNTNVKVLTKKYGGTGLGLAITKKLTHMLGGSINVTSVAGQGSTFKVIVPVERVLTPLLPQGVE